MYLDGKQYTDWTVDEYARFKKEWDYTRKLVRGLLNEVCKKIH